MTSDFTGSKISAQRNWGYQAYKTKESTRVDILHSGLFSKVAIGLSAARRPKGIPRCCKESSHSTGWLAFFNQQQPVGADNLCVIFSALLIFQRGGDKKGTLSATFFSLLPQRDWAFFVPWLHFWRGFYHTACGMCAAEEQHVNTQKGY